MILRRLRTFRRDSSGVTIIEFAMILPALCVVLMGIFDLGYRMYVTSVLQGALYDAARMATVGGVTQTQIDTMVRTRLQSFSNGATITTSTHSYDDFDDVAIPERITSDTAPFGVYNHGDCFEDYNNNGVYDLDRGRNGMGNSEDVVEYTVGITYPSIVPVTQILGWSGTESVQSSTVLRNQPYSSRTVAGPPIVCN